MIANRIITWLIHFIDRFINFHDFAAGMIVLTAVGSFIYFLILNKKMNNGIKALTRIVEDLEGTTDEKMLILNDTIKQSKNKVIKMLWQKYYNTLLKYGSEGASIDISTFFNKVTLVDIPTQRKIAEIFPGILIACGILGTFTGLVVGLNSINSESTEAIQQSMVPLMEGLKIGFLTSILGIGSSLMWNVLDRILLHRIVKSVTDFQVAYEQTFPSESMSSYLIEMIKLQDAHTAAVKEMSSNIGTSEPKQPNELIGEQAFSKLSYAISNSITKSMSPLVSNLSTLIENISSVTVDNSLNSHNYSTTETKSPIDTDINSDDINRISKSVDKVYNLQTQVNESINQLSDNVSELSSKVENSIKSTINLSLENINDNVVNSVKEMSDKIHSSIQNTFDDQMKTVTMKISETVENVNTTVENTARQFDDLRDSLKTIDSKLGDKVIYGAKTKRSDGDFY